MRQASLTFDDGPNGRYTLQILDILKQYRLKACFFLLGKNVEYYPHIARRIRRQGHLIGNHSYSHKHMKELSLVQAKEEIEKAEEVYEKILGHKPRYFRAPYGEYKSAIKPYLRAKGYRLIGWGPCGCDWQAGSPKEIVDNIVDAVKDGSIILMHDGSNIRHNRSRINTVKALPKIIEILKSRDFNIVRLDRLCRR